MGLTTSARVKPNRLARNDAKGPPRKRNMMLPFKPESSPSRLIMGPAFGGVVYQKSRLGGWPEKSGIPFAIRVEG
jgi:hypothetical protein